MFRIRKLQGALAPTDDAGLQQYQKILRARFPGMAPEDVDALPDLLGDPFEKRFTAMALVAENERGRVLGGATLLYAPEEGFAYLDALASSSATAGRGVGAALYERVREESRELTCGRQDGGLFFECLPDDPELSPDLKIRAQNVERLKFYERYGARPVIGTDYETPLTPGVSDPPYLVFDGLGTFALPSAERLKAIVRAILERKYKGLCPPDYVANVVKSIRRGGYALRGRRYVAVATETAAPHGATRIKLVVNDGHEIHHVKDRGYVEAPVRIRSILKELTPTGLFESAPLRRFPDEFIRRVHQDGLVDYIEAACADAPEQTSIYPYVFPIRNEARPPKERSVLAGYWCIDTFTPLNRNAWPAARSAVDCALTAAEDLLDGARLAYALVRPPGHHAESRVFGGFCYLNNAAIAAEMLSDHGRVALFDIDYHHGNGGQEIFYERSDVLTVSIHGDPSVAYPYFTGFADETGAGRGEGFNLNIPLPEAITPAEHRAAVDLALDRIATHEPNYLVLAVGFDTAKGDPTGTWANTGPDFRILGRMIGETGYPTLVVQEGGYRVRTLGANARQFFIGLVEGAEAPKRREAEGPGTASPPPSSAAFVWRDRVDVDDPGQIEALVRRAGVFTEGEIRIARELVEERLAVGAASGYEFALAEAGGALVGYACFGPTPGTDRRADLYWIVSDPAHQGTGLAAELLARAEIEMRRSRIERVYAETSSTQPYARARAFYERAGFKQAARLKDFYRKGDDKLVFSKNL